MKKRIITGLIMAIILIPFLLLVNRPTFAIGTLIVVLIATYEMINMFFKSDISDSTSNLIEENEPKSINIYQKAIIYILSALLFISVTAMWQIKEPVWQFKDVNIFKWYIDSFSYINVNLIISLVILLVMVFSKNFDSKWTGRAFLIIYYVALGFASFVLLRSLGRRFLVYMFLITVSTDVFAYTFGMNFGKHKMAPKISPKKSWEGAIGGTVVATILASCFALFYSDLFGFVKNIDVFNNAFELYEPALNGSLFSYICDFNGSKALEVVVVILITLTSSIMGQIGDLVASKFKRDNNIKDYSNIFPGHGGVLDRFDSSVFVSMYLLVIISILM